MEGKQHEWADRKQNHHHSCVVHLVVEPSLPCFSGLDDVFRVCADVVRLERAQVALELALCLGEDDDLSLSFSK